MGSVATGLRVLVSFFVLVVAHSESFNHDATRLEGIFDEAGLCDSGAIRFILEGNASDCTAFSIINEALTRASGDVLPASREILIDSVALEEDFSELKSSKHVFIEEKHDSYTFTNSAENDIYGCSVQTIETVAENGASDTLFEVVVESDTLVGTRSNPNCIEDRVIEVVEVKNKFESMDETEADSENDQESLDGPTVVISQTLPPAPQGVAFDFEGESAGNSTLIIALCSVTITLLVPGLVFYLLYIRKNRRIAPPTDKSEWLQTSVHEEGHPEQLV